MIHLYAVAHDLTRTPAVTGLGGAPLERRRYGGFDLVVSGHEGKVEPTEEAVLAHARVVEELVPLADAVLPARFGLGFEDELSLERAVVERATELRDSLERVRGRVELGVRVIGREAPVRAATGRDYLEARKEQLAAIDALHESLAVRATAAARGASGGQLVLTGAYLVDPESIPEFREAVGALEAEHPQLTFSLTGPWPPYSFAGVDEP